MKFVAAILSIYIVLVLLQPAYLRVANLFCTNCSASGSCPKVHTSSCSASKCCERKQAPVLPANDHSARVTFSCNTCNPFMVCSGSGFVFSSILVQRSNSSSAEPITLSASEAASYHFIHELLHPPEYSWWCDPWNNLFQNKIIE